MLPKSLTMQAFGPYVTSQKIDFSTFPHLFLIRGETGSGKTMILDAITYALYGKSSGGQREGFESMRSRFVKDDVPTLVDFSFELKGHLYHFMRKVEVKEKKNKEKAVKLTLDAGEIIEGNFYPFFENPKLKNIEEKAISLIGLTHEQFIQVMILPQGKFEQLLTSKSEDKQEILRTLFQMEKWESISTRLSEKANDMRKDMEASKQKIDALWESIQVHGKEEVQLECLEIEKKKEKQNHELQDLEQRWNLLQEDIHHQRNVQSLLEERSSLQEKEAGLQAQLPMIQERKAKILAYQEVEKILPYYQSYQRYDQAFMKRKQEYEEALRKKDLLIQQVALLEPMKQELATLKQNQPEHMKKETELLACMELFQQKKEQKKQEIIALKQEQQLQQKLQQHEEQLKQLEHQHTTLYEGYLNDTAMQLREVLKENEPCPVCGSCSHPYTEVIQQQYVDVLALKKIKEQVEEAKETKTALQMKLTKACAEAKHVQLQLEQITKEYLCKYPDYQHIDDIETLRQEHVHWKQRMQKENQRMLELENDILNIQKEKDHSELDIKTKEKELYQAKVMMEHAKTEYEQHNEHQYEEEVLKHQPNADIIEAYQKEQEEHKTLMIQISTRKKEIDLQLEQEEIKDLVQLLEQQKTLEITRRQQLSELAKLDSRKKQLQQVLKKSEAMVQAYEEMQPHYQKLMHFAKAMRGDNSVGIERYVLGVMLSNITQNANQLLQGVHHGRYQIYRSEHASGKTRKFGLEFSIYDAYTCSMRSVVSLSGGEKFLVSLALSLALSISVQARNGGISFECMFIDEGFGTLDEQSIADALTILEKMSKQKGTIGIISHVEMLKEHIPDGIEVEKTRNGSTIAIRRD